MSCNDGSQSTLSFGVFTGDPHKQDSVDAEAPTEVMWRSRFHHFVIQAAVETSHPFPAWLFQSPPPSRRCQYPLGELWDFVCRGPALCCRGFMTLLCACTCPRTQFGWTRRPLLPTPTGQTVCVLYLSASVQILWLGL